MRSGVPNKSRPDDTPNTAMTIITVSSRMSAGASSRVLHLTLPVLRLSGASLQPGFGLSQIAQRQRIAMGGATLRTLRQRARLAQHIRGGMAIGQRAIEPAAPPPA